MALKTPQQYLDELRQMDIELYMFGEKVENREIIDRLVRDLVQHSLGQPFLVFSPEIVAALHALRDFNYQHIYLSPLKQSQDTKIRAMFRQMFSTLLQQVKENDTSSPIFHDFLDGMSPKYKENTPPARMVADYIAGMTDDYFMDTYTSLFLPRKFGRQIT
jgi:dGTPase